MAGGRRVFLLVLNHLERFSLAMLMMLAICACLAALNRVECVAFMGAMAASRPRIRPLKVEWPETHADVCVRALLHNSSIPGPAQGVILVA